MDGRVAAVECQDVALFAESENMRGYKETPPETMLPSCGLLGNAESPEPMRWAQGRLSEVVRGARGGVNVAALVNCISSSSQSHLWQQRDNKIV